MSMTTTVGHTITVMEETSHTHHGTITKHFAVCSCLRFKSKKSQSYQRVERAGVDHLRGVGSRPL